MNDLWLLRALCRGLPSDWWITGDGGNRLALDLCSVCPVRVRCGQGDPAPHGVVRAGVAYRDNGDAATVCTCGRPLPAQRDRGDRGECFLCEPRWDLPVPVAHTPQRLETRRDEIAALLAAGGSYRAIGRKLGLPASSVRNVALRLRAAA